MKVLLLGIGNKNRGMSRCHPFASYDTYEALVKSADKLITLDFDPYENPDVVARVHFEPWTEKVAQHNGYDFDVIVDEITHMNFRPGHYETEAAKILKQNGNFYGWKDRTRTKWMKQDDEMKECSTF